MGDLIRREDALRMFPADIENPLWHYTGIRAALENVPTVDAVPVAHAKWRYKAAFSVNVRVSDTIYCTACGNGFHRIEGFNFRYCPNCGAKMDGA